MGESYATSTLAADATTIGIPKAVPYAQGVDVPEAVRNECQLGEKVSEFLLHDSSNVKVSDDPKAGRYLDMSITEIYAASGGRCTKTIAEDIAGWLKNPVDGAQLGDAK